MSIPPNEHPADARLRNLNEHILPRAPYLLSCPSSLKDDFIKAHYPQNALNWRKHSLFEPGEEELQYLTFKDRSGDPEVRSIYARDNWDDGKGRMAAPKEAHSRTSSDGTPRPGQAPVKKISLAEYHKKGRSKAATPAPKALAPELKEEMKNKEIGSVQDQHKDTTNIPMVKDETKAHQVENQGQKRSADEMNDTTHSESLAQPPPSPPTKRARVADEPSSTEMQKVQEQAAAKEAKAETRSTQLPTQLEFNDQGKPSDLKATENPSPAIECNVLPAIKNSSSEKPKMPRLPPMLSPLSSDVEHQIAKMTSAARNGKSGGTQPVSSANSPSLAPHKLENATPAKTERAAAIEKPAGVPKSKSTPTKGPQEQKHTTPGSGHVSKKVDLKNITTSKANTSQQPSDNKSTNTPTPKTTPPDAPKRMRLRVALKIKKKANRKNLSTYLSLKPTRGRNALFPNRPIEDESRPAASKSEVKTNKSEQGAKKDDRQDPKLNRAQGFKTGEKRGRERLDEEEPGPSSKRQATARLEQAQKPSTPKPAHGKSPVVSHISHAQKPSTSTPHAQASSTAMSRGVSGQDSVQTPQQAGAAGTPITGRRRPSWTSDKKPKSPDLRSEAIKYQKIARTLKHKADPFLRKTDPITEDERKRGLLLGTESVLCFMLAFVLMDTGASYSDRTSWNSILPFLKTVQGATQGFENLDHVSGLLCQLEAVVRDQVSYADMQKLDKNPIEHEAGNPTEEATMTEVQHKSAEYHKSYQEFHSHVMKAQNAWRTGWYKLDVAKLPSQYPKTWAGRDEQRFAYGKGRDAVMKDEYSRKYNLPMNHMTSGLEAMNFGMTFLAEWAELNGVQWEPKIKLDTTSPFETPAKK